ncbi:MAG: hypothetical protein ACJ72A_17770 [Nocardioidaceae bacterium]
MTTTRLSLTVALVLLAGAANACGNDSSTGRPTASTALPVPTPPAAAKFVRDIDNPWMPWIVGTQWRFVGKTADGTERTVVTVTSRKRVVNGVDTTVVRDVVRLDGNLLEATDDWYAQDTAGNVWYFGEDTEEYDGPNLDTSGSWEAGVHGAVAGIAMPAHPAVGDAYRQEYLAGEAEDEARVLATDANARVPYGRFSTLLKTRDFSRLEPNADELKYYAKGIGVVREVSLHQTDRTELVSMKRTMKRERTRA